jgi:hypothetical protein
MESPNIFIHGIDYSLLYSEPIEVTLNLCQINKQLNAVCNDETFWENKLKYDYPEYYDLKPVYITWKQTYFSLAKGIKSFPVYFQNNLLGYIWLHVTNTQRDAMRAIFQLINNRMGNLFFIHVLLNTPNQNPYLPIITSTDKPLTMNLPEYNGSLWQNAVGFEIIIGKITLSPSRSIDEPNNYFVVLPGPQYIRGSY